MAKKEIGPSVGGVAAAVDPASPRVGELFDDEPGHRRRRSLRVLRGHPMAAFVLRRVVIGFLTLVVVSFLIFVGTNLLPGNAAQALLGQRATPQSTAALEETLHLDRPLLARYWTWVDGVAHGDLGQSASSVLNSSTPSTVGADAVTATNTAGSGSVTSIIGTPLLNSALLAGITIIILVPLALVLGVASATRAGRWSDNALSVSLLAVVALPEFIIGALLVLLFSTGLGLLPGVSFVQSGESVLDTPDILVLPVLTLMAAALAYTVRFVRASVVECLDSDYVAAARIGGVGERRVLWSYAVRNALAPTIQVVAQTIQWLVGGIVITETVFAYPGIGSALVNAVNIRDIPTVQSIALILAALYIGLNILADVLVVFAVPKLRTNPESW